MSLEPVQAPRKALEGAGPGDYSARPMTANPLPGPAYLLRGLRLITRPGLRRFVAIPLAINVALFALAIWWGYGQLETGMAWLEGHLPEWLAWLEWVLVPLFVVTALLIVFFGFTAVANLVGAPFNGLLAEKVEEHLTGAVPEAGGGWKKALAEALPSIWDEVKKVLYFIVWAIPFLLLFLVPGVNAVAPFLWMAFSAWMLAVEYADAPMGNHDLKGREMRRRLGKRRFTALGFGGAVMVMTAIPVLNFLVMPAAVAGATALWVDHLKDA
jgi:CysZ protein